MLDYNTITSRLMQIILISVKNRRISDECALLDSVIIDDNLYLHWRCNQRYGFSDNFFSAQLPLVYPMNLYFKEGNATAEAELSTLGMVDGSVTLGQLAPDALAKIGLDHNPATAEVACSPCHMVSNHPKGTPSTNAPIVMVVGLGRKGTGEREMGI